MASRTRGAKYLPLQHYLATAAGDTLALTFAEVDRLLGRPLPASARQARTWWSNGSYQPQTRAWRAAGWRVSGVALEQQTVTFVRVGQDAG